VTRVMFRVLCEVPHFVRDDTAVRMVVISAICGLA
jgi:hypothetical protein